MLGYLLAQLVSKIFNLCGHDPPTSQTEGRTDGQTTCEDRALHCSASRGKNHGLGQYGAEPHYSTLPFWRLSAL